MESLAEEHTPELLPFGYAYFLLDPEKDSAYF